MTYIILEETQLMSAVSLTLKVLPLTEDLTVGLHEINLQHKHLFELHLDILGYNLRVLRV